MVEKVYPMTAEGKAKLEQELEELKTVKRGEIIERIKVARGFGEGSTNTKNSEVPLAKDTTTLSKRAHHNGNSSSNCPNRVTMEWTKMKFPLGRL